VASASSASTATSPRQRPPDGRLRGDPVDCTFYDTVSDPPTPGSWTSKPGPTEWASQSGPRENTSLDYVSKGVGPGGEASPLATNRIAEHGRGRNLSRAHARTLVNPQRSACTPRSSAIRARRPRPCCSGRNSSGRERSDCLRESASAQIARVSPIHSSSQATRRATSPDRPHVAARCARFDEFSSVKINFGRTGGRVAN
jgi:hypothetical protein